MFSPLCLGPFSVANHLPLFLIAGPCVIESEDNVFLIADRLMQISARLNLNVVFKASFDKANRTSVQGHRGFDLDKALRLFEKVKEKFGCLILTDVHLKEQCEPVSRVVDILQIPALLCRQTDLIQAAALTKKPLNIKKGQFLSPTEMHQVVLKAQSFGAFVMVCERGNSFGYHTLINDMKGLSVLAQTGCPVIFDATHSVQKPGALGSKSGGEREFVETLARAAVAAGVAGVFMETHPFPEQALSDGPNMVPLDFLEGLMRTLMSIDQQTKTCPYQSFSQGTFMPFAKQPL